MNWRSWWLPLVAGWRWWSPCRNTLFWKSTPLPPPHPRTLRIRKMWDRDGGRVITSGVRWSTAKTERNVTKKQTRRVAAEQNPGPMAQCFSGTLPDVDLSDKGSREPGQTGGTRGIKKKKKINLSFKCFFPKLRVLCGWICTQEITICSPLITLNHTPIIT